MNNNTDDKQWKVLKSEYLSKEPWFTARREHVQLPNGNEIPSYYLLDYPEWVNVIAITKDEKFIMVRQYRHGIGYAAMEICAGVEEENEAQLDAMKRELMEETGYGNGTWEKFMEISVNPSTHTNMTHCFLARGVEKLAEQNLEPTEDIEVFLLSREEVKGILDRDEIKQGVQVAPLWKYFALNK